MILVDVNVLVYIVNQDSEQHDRALHWWQSQLQQGASSGSIALSWISLLGFVRIATHPRILASPISVTEAIDKVSTWLAHPSTRLVAESENHWKILQEILNELGTAGNLTTDAHLAATAIGNGATLASCDTDFSRFSKLRWVNPLAS